MYVDYNGGKTLKSGSVTENDVISRFRFYKVNIQTGAIENIPGSWQVKNNGFDGDIDKGFYITKFLYNFF